MSTNNVSSFFDKILNEAALRERVNSIYDRAEATLADALAKLSTEVGAPFSAEEFRHESRVQISDDALAGVAGGVNTDDSDFTGSLLLRGAILRKRNKEAQ